MVLVRDPSAIGKKVDCPKCKYRFVVEDPKKAKGAKAADEDKPKKAPAAIKSGITPAAKSKPNGAPAAKGKPALKRPADEEEDEDEETEDEARPTKKKKAGSNKMMLGLVLAGVGVVVLGVAGYLMFAKRSEAPRRPPNVQRSGTPDGGRENPEEQPNNTKPPDPKPKPAPAVAVELSPPGPELTTLLPAKSQYVYHLFFKEIPENILDAAFQPGALDDDEFRRRLGFSGKAIDDLIHAENYAENWAFTVVHVNEALSEKALTEALGLQPAAGSPMNSQPFFKVTRNNAWLKQFGRLSIGTTPPPRSATKADRPLLLRIHDPQTLVFADAPPMLEYLARTPAAATPADAPPSSGNNPLKQPRGRPPISGATGGGSPPAQAPAASPSGPVEPYAPIAPALKALLVKMETGSADANNRALFSSVTDMEAARMASTPAGRVQWRFRVLWDVAHALPQDPQRLRLMGTALARKAKSDLPTFVYVNEFECAGDSEAKTVEKDLKEDVAPDLVRFLERLLGLKVDLPPKDSSEQPGDSTQPVARPPSSLPPGFLPRGPQPRGPTRPEPVKEKKTDPNRSRITITQADKNVVFTLDVELTDKTLPRLYAGNELIMAGFRGELELAAGTSYRGDLAYAARQLGLKGVSGRGVPPGTFPSGVFPRTDVKARAARDPAQRISWMAGLLPFLGQEAMFRRIKFDASWKDPANWMTARTVVPEFLDPTSPEDAHVARYPGVPFALGGTHVVGITGVGQDAADYSASDMAVAAKLGVFGYDRRTSLDEIKKNRGLASTALMVQVPYNGPAGVTPWMAGGGSTIRGVPEKDSVKPFIATSYGGKRGTFLIMADGSVRFVGEDVKDEVFKAMCTIKGPADALVDLDRDAPRVKLTRKADLGPPKEIVKEAGPAKPATPKGWEEFTSKEGRFSVWLPGSPKRAEQPTQGGGKMTLFMAPLAAKKMAFFVQFSDLPPADLKKDHDQLISEMQRELAANLKGATITKETAITLGKHPGREYEVALTDKGASIFRIYVVEDRVYMLIVAGADLTAAAPDVQTFFESFKLISGRGKAL
jgi:hypothetical protein